MRKIILTLLLAIMATLVSPPAWADGAAPACCGTSDSVCTCPNGPVLNPTTIKQENAAENYQVEVSFPQAACDKGKCAKFNQYIRKLAEEQVAHFKDNLPPRSPSAPPFPSRLVMTYEVIHLAPGFASIVLEPTFYYVPAAHPTHTIIAVNYRFDSGKALGLTDLFKPNSDYLEMVSAYCIKDLKKQAETGGYRYEEGWLQHGAGPYSANFKLFTLGSDSLTIIFPEYQVAPYSEGIKKVAIPYSELTTCLVDNAPPGTWGK